MSSDPSDPIQPTPNDTFALVDALTSRLDILEQELRDARGQFDTFHTKVTDLAEQVTELSRLTHDSHELRGKQLTTLKHQLDQAGLHLRLLDAHTGHRHLKHCRHCRRIVANPKATSCPICTKVIPMGGEVLT